MSLRNDSLRSSSPALGGQPSREYHAPSHESLTAHPLLNPSPSSLTLRTEYNETSSNSSLEPAHISSSSNAPTTAPKYLPYTPRQRVPTGSATTGTTVSSPVSVSPLQNPQVGAASATGKLQLQNLKAIAQSHGLDANSIGWAMLEELVSGTDHNPLWNEIWSIVATGKASLLLPTEQLSSHEIITPEFVRDHVVFCNGSARNDSPIVTLSGLRGTIDEYLTIWSTVATFSKTFQSLASPASRSSTLSALPPLPNNFVSSPSYPRFLAPNFIPSLPVPPRVALPPKPPLPPRPGSRPSTSAQSVSRLANPFASFFSKSSSPATPAAVSAPLLEPPHIDHVIEISAFTIEKPIIQRNVAKALAKIIKGEIRERLSGLPNWVIDRAQNFSAGLQPFPKPARSKGENSTFAQRDQVSTDSISAYDDAAEDISQSFQSFYESLEEELKVEGSPSTLRKRDDRHHDENKEREKHGNDKKVKDTLEKVEKALTSIFYDRLFLPSNSDDASHDEALSSRIAALNMLDLSLDHLGVDVGAAGSDVDAVVTACGEALSDLEHARCPADKAAILVATHRIIVDGLSKLPPLHLKSDDLIDDEKTPQNANFDSELKPDSHLESLSSGDITPSQSSSTPHANSNLPLEASHVSETIKPDIQIPEDSAASISSLTLSPEDSTVPPLLSVSPPKTPTPVSGDILLPLIIFSVVKTNPSQLVSHLLYTQRFRNRSFGGEEGYCLINLMAVVEFLENVDLAALGLKGSESKVISTADLTPIPLTHPALSGDQTATAVVTPGLRGRVEQQVDAIAGSANKVFSGVVDSGFGVLRALLPVAPGEHPSSPDHVTQNTPWNNIRPGFGLLRRESGFSIASLAASLPVGRDRARSIASSYHPGDDEEGQEMIESRPGSVRNLSLNDDGESEGSTGSEEDDAREEDPKHDTRSIKSFESMMSGRSKHKPERKDRMSLTDRLANMSRLTRGTSSQSHDISIHNGSPPPRAQSLLSAKEPNRPDTPVSSRAASPISGNRTIPPPNKRFLECTAEDLRMSEIPELLQEYRRLADALKSFGGFDDLHA